MGSLTNFIKRIQDITRNDAGVSGDAQRIEQLAWMLFLKVYDAKEQDWEAVDPSYRSIIPEGCRWHSWASNSESADVLTGDKLLDFVNGTLFPTLKGLQVTASTPIRQAIVKATFEDANNYMKNGVLLRQVINVIDELDLGDYNESHAFGEIYETILKGLQSAGNAGEFYTPRAVTDFMAKMIQPQIGEKMADFACGTGGFIVSWLKELEHKVVTASDQKEYGSSIFGIEKKQFPYMLCVTNLLLHCVDLPFVEHANALAHDVLDYTEKDQFDVVMMNPPYGGSELADIINHYPKDIASSETADLFLSVIMYRLKHNGRCAIVLPDGFLFGMDNAKVNLKKRLLNEFNLHTIVRLPGSVFAPYTPIATNLLFFDRTGKTKETWFYRLDMPKGYKHFSKTKPICLKHFTEIMEWWNNRKELFDSEGAPKAQKFTCEQLAEEHNYNFDLCGYPHKEIEILSPMDLVTKYKAERSRHNLRVDCVLSNLCKALVGDAIDAQPQEHDDHKLDAQIALKIKYSVLQYAFQGNLATQTNSLLPKLSFADVEDEPFEIPSTWQWAKLGDCCQMYTGNSIPPEVKQSQYVGLADGLAYIGTKDVSFEHVIDYNNGVRIPADNPQFRKAPAGSVLFCVEGGSAGKKIAMTEQEVCFGNKLCMLYSEDMLNKFIYYYLQSCAFNKMFTGNKTGIIGGVGINRLKSILLPVPPLDEQKRIVAKIEELLALCDKLESLVKE